MSKADYEELKRAAEAIRGDWGEPWSDELTAATFHLAVADWLDHDAEVWEQYEKQGMGLAFARRERSIAVARAYLGEDV